MAQGPNGVKDPLPNADKAEWRRWARQRRAELDLDALSAALAAPLQAWLDRQAPTTVVAYRAMAGELSLDALVAGDRRHRWATTRTPASGPLTVHPWHSPLERHRFGFVQPVADAPVVAADEIGVVLCPGLAFDRGGGRLGYGKGYYDRLLAGLDAVAVGVTATALIVDRLPTAAHDRSMHVLAVEGATMPCSPRL